MFATGTLSLMFSSTYSDLNGFASRFAAVSSEAWAKLRVWASVAGRGRLLLSGSVAHASLETVVGVEVCF